MDITSTVIHRCYWPDRCVDICTEGAKSRVSKAKAVGALAETQAASTNSASHRGICHQALALKKNSKFHLRISLIV